MLTEKAEQSLRILPNGVIEVRDERVIEDNGVEIDRIFHNKVIDVDDDVSNESDRIKGVSGAVWTPQVKAARAAQKAQNP